jgi:hypothetical protein
MWREAVEVMFSHEMMVSSSSFVVAIDFAFRATNGSIYSRV